MQVFVSHCGTDRPIAEALIRDFQAAGVNVWNPYDAIYPGENPALAMGKALEESDILVVLLTQQSKQSSMITGEVQYALTSGNYRGRVVPVIVDRQSFQPGVDAPWILSHLTPIYLDGRPLDFSPVVQRVKNVMESGSHASA